ncbi:acyloxyacyl hydrolase [Arsenicitalea aurantiaca]|uniref:Acyloxyacyl hydrolase n=1 Tax=Arsenicitalea aurantiaca TaxID=1783274 RepID=A0A433X5H0_9HYPH|nr:acyloxyacyl hydrolase [Arsenicitalea aurantiaca]RUT29325.1 acyloxyacyl hydrolase [Arsenicitalea aurantiaca]
MRKSFFGIAAAIILAIVPGVQPALAQGFALDELRGGIFAHSVDRGGPDSTFGLLDLNRIEDLNVELLFTTPDADLLRWIGSPRPHFGLTLNFGGLESMSYAGLTWTVPVFDTPFFIEGSFGAAVHNGGFSDLAAPRRNLGCTLHFRESVSLGYRFTPEASVMLTAEHASHAGLCGPDNEGLTNLGVRFGYRF